MEETRLRTPSIRLVVEDENLDCERIHIYDFPPTEGQYLVSEVFRIGNRMHVINPYLRTGAYDLKPKIRIDDFSSIIMLAEQEKATNTCRCRGQANALHVCAKCEKTRYYSRECQVTDWKIYEHKLICQ